MSLPSSLKLKQPAQEQSPKMPSSLKLKQKEDAPPDFQGESEEETQKNIERSQARSLSRIGETALGVPGDIASFFAGMFGKEQNILPTSSKLKRATGIASQGYLDPQNKSEEFTDELVSDITAMALPGAGKYNFVRNIGIPLAGNLVKQGLKYGNADEKTQGYAKIGTLVALDLMSRKTGGAKAYASSLFNKAEQALPEGLSFSASNLEKSLDKLEKTLSLGGKRPTTTKALEKVSEIKKEIKDGKINAKSLAAYRPSINEAIDDLGGFNFEISKKLKPQAIRNLNEVKGEVIKSLNEYGKKYNPEYAKYSHEANEAWAAYSKSNKIANFLKNKVPYTPKSKAVQFLFSAAPTTAIVGGLTKVSPLAAAGAGAAAAGYQGLKIFLRVKESPVLRKYYLNTLKEAAAGNVPQTAKNLRALDESLADD